MFSFHIAIETSKAASFGLENNSYIYYYFYYAIKKSDCQHEPLPNSVVY